MQWESAKYQLWRRTIDVKWLTGNFSENWEYEVLQNASAKKNRED
jgi:hypothetical protein